MRRFISDNLTLAPASQLPFKDEWRQIANGLPTGSVLFIVPTDETPMTRSLRQIARTLRRQGRSFATVRCVRHDHA